MHHIPRMQPQLPNRHLTETQQMSDLRRESEALILQEAR